MKRMITRLMAAALSLAVTAPAHAQSDALSIQARNLSALGLLAIPRMGPPIAVTPNGTAISLPASGGVQIQIAGLSADTLTVTQSLDCTNYVTATLLKHDLSQATGSLTGSTNNGIYSVMVFGGCLKITRTGSADTLAVTYRGTN